MQEEAIIVTDGSADNQSGTGGWCAIVRTTDTIVELTGWATGVTSNRMEMMAVIEGLREVALPSKVTLVADSAYVLNALKNEWYKRWLTEVRPTPRPNLDLWAQLAGLMAYHEVQLVKVKGHSGDYWNTRADKLAGHARINQSDLRNVLPNYEFEKETDDSTAS